MGGTRDFRDVQEMNEVMICNWNQCVKRGDLVFHLGDFAFPNKGDGTEIEEILDKLNSQIYLIQGNHDHKNKFEKLYKAHPKFVKIEDLGYIKLDNGQKVMLSHYPMLTWRASCHGSWNLHGHAVSEDTELLTNTGFILIDNIKIGQHALTLNMKTNKLEYNEVEKIYKHSNFREMISFNNKAGTMLLSPFHIVIYQNTMKQLNKEIAINSMQRKHLKIPVSGFMDGITYDKPYEFFKLLGFIISEGGFLRGKNSGCGIRISQSPKTMSYIQATLELLNVPYTIHNKNKVSQSFYLPAGWVKKNIYGWIYEKRISTSLMNLRGRQFLAFLSGLIYGDGQVYSMENKEKSICCNELIDRNFDNKMVIYFTGDEILKDQLCHLCTLNGLQTTSRYKRGGYKDGSWYIGIINRQYINFRNSSRKLIDYHKRVWCISTKNKTFVARRNGFIFITGNCHGQLPQLPGKRLDVGVDTNDFFPYSEYDIIRIMAEKSDNLDIGGFK